MKTHSKASNSEKRTYNAGQHTDGEEVRVNNVSEFWETARAESLKGARFNLHSYAMMCYDDLPLKIREALQNSKDDHNTADIWEKLNRDRWSIDMVIEYIEYLEKGEENVG